MGEGKDRPLGDLVAGALATVADLHRSGASTVTVTLRSAEADFTATFPKPEPVDLVLPPEYAEVYVDPSEKAKAEKAARDALVEWST